MHGGRFHSLLHKRVILPIFIIVIIFSISITSIIIFLPFPQQPITKTSIDNNGITKIYETKGGEKQEYYGFDYEHKARLDREQFYLEDAAILDGEYTAYAKLDNKEKEDDDISFKIRGGEHNDDYKYAGRSYAVGVSFNGDPYLAKEYPYHPVTPKFLNEIRIANGNDNDNDNDYISKNIGNLDGRWIGIKVIAYNKNNAVNIEVYVDNKGLLSNGKPANHWNLWWTAVDDGKWVNDEGKKGGEPYLELQGEKGGTPEMTYIRIDKMKEKGQIEIKHESVREIDASNKLV
ncbi:MAG TPA: hypothetical protein VD815_09715 [Candidatus Saccharimonadales bacterium]|nr:hypothetical protein [Candidatus Saccharimonadales bacterium]